MLRVQSILIPRPALKTVKALSIGFVLASVLVSCAKQEFQVAESTVTSEPAGQLVMPTKVDVILAEDDTGSMAEAYEKVRSQIPGFLNTLEAQGWDYRFTTTPLTHLKSSSHILQVMASKYDGNWFKNGSGLWQEPFPGADPNAPEASMPSLHFFEPFRFTQFLAQSSIDPTTNADEPGLRNIYNFITERATGSGIPRKGVPLVVVVLSNGEDTSDVNYCVRGFPSGDYDKWVQAGKPKVHDGWIGTCDLIYPNLSNSADSFENLRLDYKSIVTDQLASDVSMYALVAFTRNDNCLGAVSRVGNRYKNMAAALGGKSYDVCNTPMSGVFDSLSKDLKNKKLSFRTRYLVIQQEPDLTKPIKVIRYKNGNPNNTVEIPSDELNGWAYRGFQTVNTIDFPTEQNPMTGYVFELNGNAKLVGADTATVQSTPKIK